MKHFSFLFIICLFPCFIQGSGAQTPLFVAKGKDVFLDASKPADLSAIFVFTWTFNTSDIIILFVPPNEPIVSNRYAGRVEFSEATFSLRLKRLQLSDSGGYVSRVIENAKALTLAEYEVTALEPVSPVVLRVDSVSVLSVSCNVTVSCRAHDSDISSTFTCQNQTCSQEGGQASKVTPSGASLHIYMSNGSVVCNHSNQVSTAEDTGAIEWLCRQRPDSAPLVFTLPDVWIVVIAFGVVFALAVVCHRLCRKCKRNRASRSRANNNRI